MAEGGPEAVRVDDEVIAPPKCASSRSGSASSSPRSIGGIAVRDLMLLAVERRISALRAPMPVEWLADNGSCFTAHETIAFAYAIGLMPCFTPVRSPELSMPNG